MKNSPEQLARKLSKSRTQLAGEAATPKNTAYHKRLRKHAIPNTPDTSEQFANSLAGRSSSLDYPLPEIPDPLADAHPSIIHYSLVLGIGNVPPAKGSGIHPSQTGLDHDHVCLVRRPKNTHIFPDHYNLPGGLINTPHEKVEAGAAREFTEETGWPCNHPVKCGTMLITRGELSIAVHCVNVFVPRHDNSMAPPRASEHPCHWFNWADIQYGRVVPLPRNLRILIPLMMKGVQNWILYFPYDCFPQWDVEHSILSPEEILTDPPGHAILCY